MASRRDFLGLAATGVGGLVIGSVLGMALKSWCRDTITRGFESRTSVHVYFKSLMQRKVILSQYGFLKSQGDQFIITYSGYIENLNVI